MIKILVVDDEPGMCEILKRTFVPMGFSVLSAYSGLEALTLVKKEKPKLVFLDIRMQGMSGLEALAQIKKIDAKIKVMMLTVADDEKTRKEAAALGADGFITKPFMSDYLEEVVRNEIAELIKEEQINAKG